MSTPVRSSARVAVLLHGLASNASRWSEFIELSRLPAAGWQLVPFDLLGHGAKPTRGRVGMRAWCLDLAAMLAYAGLPHTVLIGHSLGAHVALHMASNYPCAVDRLVLIDPVFRAALRGRRRAQILLRWPLVAAAAVLAGLNRIGLGRRALAPLDLRTLDAQARVALRSGADKAAFIRQYSSARADLRHIRTGHYLQEMAEMLRPLPRMPNPELPILVLLSSGATFADAAATRTIAAGLSRAVTIETIDCEHWPLTERPAEVREAIERWCAGQPAGPAER